MYNCTKFCDYLKQFDYVSITNLSIFHIDFYKKLEDCCKMVVECHETFNKKNSELDQKFFNYGQYLTSVSLHLNILL